MNFPFKNQIWKDHLKMKNREGFFNIPILFKLTHKYAQNIGKKTNRENCHEELFSIFLSVHVFSLQIPSSR